MTKFTYQGQTLTTETLEAASSDDLVTLYNKIADDLNGRHVNRFSDKRAAVKRVTGMLVQVAALAETEAQIEAPKAKPAKAAKEKKVKAKKDPKRATGPNGENIFRLPPSPVADQREPKGKRGIVWKMYSRARGATLEDALEASGWKTHKNRATGEPNGQECIYQATRLISVANGYGIVTDVKGRVHAVTTAAEYQAILAEHKRD